ncbi:MAG: DUF616 domain-containing protein [Lachnospiraceae bacterium]|nr:DUF616 domain-containing protein [Lachnospiraceae bacterium]
MNPSMSNLLCEVCTGEKKLCVFGMGIAAQTSCKFLLDELGIVPDCYTDNNPARWGEELFGRPCISPDELFRQRDQYACIISTTKHADTIGKQLDEAGLEDWIIAMELQDLFLEDSFLAYFIGIDKFPPYVPLYKEYPPHAFREYAMGNRVAVYSCITGGYDTPVMTSVCPDNIDYFMITDDVKVARDAGWPNVIDIDKVVPKDIDRNDPALMNRWCKMNGHRLFQKYHWSIYIDGKLKPKVNISKYVKYTSQIGISTCLIGVRHKDLNARDLYGEGFCLKRIFFSKGILNDKLMQKVKKQLRKYASEGFPRQKFQIEASAIVRDHDNILADIIMDEWFEEYEKGVRRDQLSFEYVLWRNGIDMKDYCPIPFNTSQIFEWIDHAKVKDMMN